MGKTPKATKEKPKKETKKDVKVEQEQNLKSLNAQNICSAEINCSAEEFAELCKRQMSCGIDHPLFEPGNAMVIDRIINL